MPTYEFRCPEGHEFEKLYRTISGAESVAACPTCGKAAERMMSATGFAFKGSGFYLTDYGKNAHRGETAPAAKGGEGGSDGGSSKAESADAGSKPAAEAPKAAESTVKPAETKKAEPKAAEAKPAPAKKPSAE